MVKCRFCGFDNPDKYVYCMHCSKKLELSNSTQNNSNHEKQSDDNDLKDLYYSFLNNDSNNAKQPTNTFNISDYSKNIQMNKKQFLATLFSAIICGSGYFYLKNTKKGLFFFFGQIFIFVAAEVLYALANNSNMVYFMYTVNIMFYLFNVYDTLIESNKGVEND